MHFHGDRGNIFKYLCLLIVRALKKKTHDQNSKVLHAKPRLMSS